MCVSVDGGIEWRMDGWVDGEADIWIDDEWVCKRRMEGGVDAWVDEWMDVWMSIRTYGVHVCMGRWTDGWCMHIWMDR